MTPGRRFCVFKIRLLFTLFNVKLVTKSTFYFFLDDAYALELKSRGFEDSAKKLSVLRN